MQQRMIQCSENIIVISAQQHIFRALSMIACELTRQCSESLTVQSALRKAATNKHSNEHDSLQKKVAHQDIYENPKLYLQTMVLHQ
jgi:hypothetical protein